MIHAWEASCNSDSVEGRGYKVILGYFTEKDDADKVVENRGPMGVSDGDVVPIRIFESMKEYTNDKMQKARASAMGKLSSEELKALFSLSQDEQKTLLRLEGVED